MATIVLGIAFGNEGNSKLVGILSNDVKLWARAQGGHNARHTAVANGVSSSNTLRSCSTFDFGTYASVSSSNTGLGGIFTALALDPRKFDHIIGVIEACSTRVGLGHLPTQLFDADSKKLQKLGHEVRVSTGRPRRCGWPDLMVIKHSRAINPYTSLNLIKLEILDTFPFIIAYKNPRTDEDVPSFPADQKLLESVEVVCKELECWNTPTTSVTSYYGAPLNARKYIELIKEFVGVKIGWIGTSPEREDMIIRMVTTSSFANRELVNHAVHMHITPRPCGHRDVR
ncbi:LOW QUALITY PROTEIN: Adenylosuccinate synthetase-domain-containing protein [Microdochium trichocladiopsis]|uniref:Adenylosuccinate synthetase n=1 Tax=Microdochium trichocladiopsis TaxID=1682393 RepID=A0A9P9BVG9_9PEZI|nr:LOW QUALITY PROTEIN: Adenylosuccinate synthetase-domain-containing protein [Microdochium trichocladiopsis]KAH7040258.1 LOW QUALITY PROTEIN: Adenylosuccinate synthetase-domain-containing protein [Microdochium trichocladiopsis]